MSSFTATSGPVADFRPASSSPPRSSSTRLLFGVVTARRVAPPRLVNTTLALGVLLYAGTGFAGLLLGGNYLDYSVLAHDPVHGQHLGISLIEFGVFMTVSSAMITIFFVFAGHDVDERAD